MTTETFTLTSQSPWTCPAGVHSVQVDCTGGSGFAAGSNGAISARGGGGGGAFARLNAYSVTPGNTYAFQVGTAGTGTATPGTATFWVATGTLRALGGQSSQTTDSLGAAGGLDGSTGNVHFKGGDGAAGVQGTGSGGGGAAASASGAGANGSGTTGGVGVSGAGSGANGRTTTGVGAQGTAPGGGASGAYRTTTGTSAGANGQPGQIVLTYIIGADGTATTAQGQTAAAAGTETIAGTATTAQGQTAVAAGSEIEASTASTGQGQTVAATGGETISGTATTSQGQTAASTGGELDAGTATTGQGQTVSATGAVSQGAGRHKRYGVKDGWRLLVFDTREEANAARKALAQTIKPERRIKVRAAEVIELPKFKALANTQGEGKRYDTLLATQRYNDLVALYTRLALDEHERRERLEKAEAMRREEEEIATILLHLL